MPGLQAPKMINGASNDGSVVISHREFLGDVRTATTAGHFAVSAYTINPGNEKTFPWLSQIARNFQEYRLEGMAFHFRTMSADALNSTNTALGSVFMCTQYDPTLPTPNSKSQMENIEFAQSVKPSQSCMHFIECAKNQTPLTNLYVAPDPESIVGDPRFYDFAKFFIGTTGMQAADVNIGELWITYQIRLFKPMLFDALGNGGEYFYMEDLDQNLKVYKDYIFGQQDISDPDLMSGIWNPNSTIYPIAHVTALGQVRFPQPPNPKTYMICIHWKFPDGNVDLGIVAVSQCTLNKDLMNGNSQIQAPNDNAGAATCLSAIVYFYINCDGANLGKGYWQFSLTATTLGDATNMDPCDYFSLLVVEVPYQKLTS